MAGTLVLAGTSAAHEGHAALPSTGVVRDGDQLLVSPAAVQAIGMRTETITLGDIRRVLWVNARVDLPWSGQARVTTLTDGKIASLLVKPGEQVRAGQELARVESLELETLQAELLQSAAAIQSLESLIAARENLAARGALENRILLESKAELLQRQAEHEITRRKLQALGLDEELLARISSTGETVGSLPVVAPINGTIEHVDARPGQLVETTDHLFDIVDLATLYVVGDVPEGDSYLVEEGLPVTVTFAGLPDREFTARVDHVRLKMNRAQRSLQAVATVDNREALLRPGMVGRMAIEFAAATQEIVCPTSALIETEGGVAVLRRDAEGKYSRRPVKIGIRSPQLAVIQSGLFPGQQVITRGRHLLAAMFDDSADPAVSVAQREETGPTDATASAAAAERRPQRVLAAWATAELPTSQKAVGTSLLEGRVASIRVEPGQAVEAGEVLVEVESQQLRSLQLELLLAAGKLRWTQGEVERLQLLAASGGASARELQQRQMETRALRFQVSGLERRLALIGLPATEIARLAAAQWSSDDSPAISGRMAIRAPIAGRVADIGLTRGELVHAHDTLFEIQDARAIWIKALILESDAHRIRPGLDTTVTFAAHPHLRAAGQVVRMAPQLTGRESVLPIWIEVPNPDGFLKEGMLARVEIQAPAEPAVVAGVP